MLFVNIDDRESLLNLFNRLDNQQIALWGKMNIQQMVEHLIKTIQMTNGKEFAQLKTSEENSLKAKQALIYTDMEMMQGIKSSLMGEEPDPLKYKNLQDAINQLFVELDNFAQYHRQNTDARPIHPRMGALNYEEWKILHSKHFTHHFKQFGIL